MREPRSTDYIVRKRLQCWPQHPPGLPERGPRDAKWLRGRPVANESFNPYLKIPGSERLRTVPDGLWLNFGGTVAEPFVDIFCVEACGTMQNLLDKRSRFAPRISSLMAFCPLPWLHAPVMPNGTTPRWRATGVINDEPKSAMSFPVRDIRVLYGLNTKLYNGFLKNQVPQPHEYFAPIESLTAEDGDKNPAMQALLARAAVTANFLTMR
jgi:hypothetical protein